MKLVVLEGLSAGAEYPLGSVRLVFGRWSGCAVVLDDDEVSREHCHILPSDDGYVIEDLGSRNGTIVDGELIERPTDLRSGSLVVVGRTLFELRGAAPSATGAAHAGAAHAGADDPPRGSAAASVRDALLAGRRVQDSLAALLPALDRDGGQPEAGGRPEARCVLAMCRACATDPDPQRRVETLRSAMPALQRTASAALDLLGSLLCQS